MKIQISILLCLIGSICGQERSLGGSSVRRNRFSIGISHSVGFNCPEDFGYYPHPTDCSQYYVCVFGGALQESCTGGLMYSNDLQTCDWPRNVICNPSSTNSLSAPKLGDPRAKGRGPNAIHSSSQPLTSSASLISRGIDNSLSRGETKNIRNSKSVFDDTTKIRQGRFITKETNFPRNFDSRFQAQGTSSRTFNVIPSAQTPKTIVSFPPSVPVISSNNRLAPGRATTQAPLIDKNFYKDILNLTDNDYYYYYDDILYDDYYEPTIQKTTTARSVVRSPNRGTTAEPNHSDDLSGKETSLNSTNTDVVPTARPKPSTHDFQTATLSKALEENEENNNIGENKSNKSPKIRRVLLNKVKIVGNRNNENDKLDKLAIIDSGNKFTTDNEISKPAKRKNKRFSPISTITVSLMRERARALKISAPIAKSISSRSQTTSTTARPRLISRLPIQRSRVSASQIKVPTVTNRQRSRPVTALTARKFPGRDSNKRIPISSRRSNIFDRGASTLTKINNFSRLGLPSNKFKIFTTKRRNDTNDVKNTQIPETKIPFPMKVRESVRKTQNSPSKIDQSINTRDDGIGSVKLPILKRPRIIMPPKPKRILLNNRSRQENKPSLEQKRFKVTTTVESSTTRRTQQSSLRAVPNHRTLNNIPLRSSGNDPVIVRIPLKRTKIVAPQDDDTSIIINPFISSFIRENLRAINAMKNQSPSIAAFDESEFDLIIQEEKAWREQAAGEFFVKNSDPCSNNDGPNCPSSNVSSLHSPIFKSTLPPYKDSSDPVNVKEHQNDNAFNDDEFVPKQKSATITFSQLMSSKNQNRGSNVFNFDANHRTSTTPRTILKPVFTPRRPAIKPSLKSIPHKSPSKFPESKHTKEVFAKPSQTTSTDRGTVRAKQRTTNTKSSSSGGNTQVFGRSPQRLVRPSKRPPPRRSSLITDIWNYPPRRPNPLYQQPQVDVTAARCDTNVCRLPDCSCGGPPIPGNIQPRNVPQIVLLTFDDSVNDLNRKLYVELFERGRVNPNGCPITATFYVSHEWTDYSQVQNLYSDGHEIASHSITHSFGEQFNTAKWSKEIGGQREIMSAYGGVRMEDIRGMRAPFLAIGGNNMFRMLYNLNFTYDSSMPVYENNPPSWPYTLDYKIFHDCMIPPCPTNSYPGVWQVPMVMWQDLNGGRCSMGDACTTPPDAEGVYKMLIKNFERHYTTNRAPMGLYYHAAWFTTPHHKEGFIAFLDTIAAMDDVWLVTNWQALQWVRDPQPLNQVKSFKHFGCNYPERPPRCKTPKVCNVWHKGSVRYLKTCQTCPESYPWVGKTGVQSPLNSL